MEAILTFASVLAKLLSSRKQTNHYKKLPLNISEYVYSFSPINVNLLIVMQNEFHPFVLAFCVDVSSDNDHSVRLLPITI